MYINKYDTNIPIGLSVLLDSTQQLYKQGVKIWSTTYINAQADVGLCRSHDIILFSHSSG